MRKEESTEPDSDSTAGRAARTAVRDRRRSRLRAWSRITSALIAVGLFASVRIVSAAPPDTISHQGLLVLPNGQVAPDGTYQLRFEVCEAASGGSCGWAQLVSVNLRRGLYGVLLSSPGLRNAFSSSSTWIATTIVAAPAGTGIAANTVLGPRQQVASVPYALSALSAASVDGGGSGQKWSAFSTGFLRTDASPNVDGTWYLIPGLQVSVNLSSPSALVFAASGFSNRYLNSGTCENRFRIVVDDVPINGLPVSDSTGDFMHAVSFRGSRWSFLGRTSGGVSAGTHTIKVQSLSSPGGESSCVVCGNGSNPPVAAVNAKCGLRIEAEAP